MGDTMHTQTNGYDSAFMFDGRQDYSAPGKQPLRILALAAILPRQSTPLAGTAGSKMKG